MDRTAVRLINTLLGNDAGEAVLEMHFPAPQIIFEANAVAAIGGADFAPTLDGQRLENWRPFIVKKGSVLKFTGKITGNRAYLALKGGFKTDEWLGSASTNLAVGIGGFKGHKLEHGDSIPIKAKVKSKKAKADYRISNSLIPHYSRFPTVRILPGAEFEFLSERGREMLLHQDFTISTNSNRMGFRLTGEPITLAEPCESISSAVDFGTIQLLPDGQLIVLMADHQTAGGYPRIGHVITRDLPLMAQLGANDKVAFHLVKTADAENLALEFEREVNLLKVAVRLKTDF